MPLLALVAQARHTPPATATVQPRKRRNMRCQGDLTRWWPPTYRIRRRRTPQCVFGEVSPPPTKTKTHVDAGCKIAGPDTRLGASRV